jgi:hypothetical protein
VADPLRRRTNRQTADRSPRPEPANDNRPADRAEREVRRYLSRWVPWAIVYAVGLAVLWAAGLWGTPVFYAWAIGWVLVWGVWVQLDYVRRYVWRRERDGPGRENGAG